MRSRVTAKFGAPFFDFGKGPFIQQCHNAMKILTKNNNGMFETMLQEFVTYIRRPDGVMDTVRALKAMHPKDIWTYVLESGTEYRHLADKASKVSYATNLSPVLHALMYCAGCSFSHAQLVPQEESAITKL